MICSADKTALTSGCWVAVCICTDDVEYGFCHELFDTLVEGAIDQQISVEVK